MSLLKLVQVASLSLLITLGVNASSAFAEEHPTSHGGMEATASNEHQDKHPAEHGTTHGSEHGGANHAEHPDASKGK